jgi:hypothetical protein
MPKLLKKIVYAFVFIIIVFGFKGKISWFVFLFLGLIFYMIVRFMTTKCHHKYTGIPMILTLSVIVLFDIANFRANAILAMTMLFDVFL